MRSGPPHPARRNHARKSAPFGRGHRRSCSLKPWTKNHTSRWPWGRVAQASAARRRGTRRQPFNAWARVNRENPRNGSHAAAAVRARAGAHSPGSRSGGIMHVEAHEAQPFEAVTAPRSPFSENAGAGDEKGANRFALAHADGVGHEQDHGAPGAARKDGQHGDDEKESARTA